MDGQPGLPVGGIAYPPALEGSVTGDWSARLQAALGAVADDLRHTSRDLTRTCKPMGRAM